ncbi:MBG domain-containing protein [uncultured Acetobacteroides sp.]|uniref:MBG domain-containing protein n=1 Tax=uncultured Acetobacteroides sp. TaxID=1760811 RepID=UPI0029F52D3B|nr:MBG domain-containing protein [uncultured Acetobacteroides sp.]
MKRFLRTLALWLTPTMGALGQTAAAAPAAVPKRRSSRLPLLALTLALLAIGGQATAQTFVFGTGTQTKTSDNHFTWTENGNTLDIVMTNAETPTSGLGTSAWKLYNSSVKQKSISVTFSIPGYYFDLTDFDFSEVSGGYQRQVSAATSKGVFYNIEKTSSNNNYTPPLPSSVCNGITSFTVTVSFLSNDSNLKDPTSTDNLQFLLYITKIQLSNVAKIQKPQPPTSVSATPGDEQATVSFSPPANNGGEPATSYTVTSSPGGIKATGTASPIVVPGLTNGTPYTFTVTATNSAGDGSPSDKSTAVTPFYKPDVLVVSNGWYDEKKAAPQLVADLSDRYDVTVTTTGVPASLDGYAQIYDVRVNEAITDNDLNQYGLFLSKAKGKSVFVAGEDSRTPAFDTRNQSISKLIETLGGGTITPPSKVSYDAVLLKTPFNTGSSNISTVALSSPGIVASSGTGSFIATEANGTSGAGVYFPKGTLANATEGCLVVMYDINFTYYNDNSDQKAFRANLEQVMAAGGTRPGPIASSVSLSATPNPVAKDSRVTITATVKSGINGAMVFKKGDDVWTRTTLDNDVASITTALESGTYSITAQYAGDANLNASTSEALTLVVCTEPDAPTIGAATAGDGKATVSFTPPTNNGGSPITSYTVTANPVGAGKLVAITVPATGITPGVEHTLEMTGLNNGIQYNFTVTANNAALTSKSSEASNSVTPKMSQTITFDNPGAQLYGTTPTLSAKTTLELKVTYTSMTTDVCTITSGGALNFVSVGTCTVVADQAGTALVKAAPSVSQSFAVTPVAPSAPIGVSAIAGDEEAKVSFFHLSNKGEAPVTGYTVTATPGGITATGTRSPIIVPDLTNDNSYTFTVTANSKVGPSKASDQSKSVTPFYKPDVLVVSNNQSEEKSAADRLVMDLSARYDVTVSTNGAPASLDSYAQIYDVRISEFYIPSGDITQYTKFLNKPNKSLFLVGGTPWYELRNQNVSNFIKELGGGTIAPPAAKSDLSDVALKVPFNTGASSISTSPLTYYGIVTESGNGSFIATEANGTSGAGLYFPKGTLANAKEGCLVVMYNISLLASPYNNYDFRMKLEQVMAAGGTLPGPSATSTSLSATASPVAQKSPVTLTATVTSGATGQVQFVDVTKDGTNALGTPSLEKGVATLTTLDLTLGTHTITAQYTGDAAHNASASEKFELVVCAAPDVPTIGTATADDGKATVSFTASASDGGSPITVYTVTATPEGTGKSATITVPATGITPGTKHTLEVAGLTNGTKYSFTVTASNAVLTSAPSSASNSVTPKPNVLIISSTETAIKAAADKLNEDLSSTYNVTLSTTGVPASLNGYAQIYDLRYENASLVTATEQAQYVSFLNTAKGNTLLLTGEHPNPSTDQRNKSINELIALAGGGTIAPPAKKSTESLMLKIPFNTGASSISSVTTVGCGTVTSSGTGSFIATEGDGTVGGGLYFPQGTLANAKEGCLVVMYDIDFTSSTPNINANNEQEFFDNLKQVMAAGGTLAGPSASTVSLSGTPNPTAKHSPVTFTATVTPGATGEVLFTEDGNVLDKITIDNGVATFSYPSIGLGERSIKAKYIGDARYNASTSEVFKLNVYDRPAAPTIGTATAGDGQATVSFTPSTNNGELPITSYTVIATPVGTGKSATITVLATGITPGIEHTLEVTGLANGTKYSFTVTASNKVGVSKPSMASNSVTPMHTSVIAWSNPADITYGTALGKEQFNATADVPGTFAYTPAVGTVLNAGNAQAITATFTPNDKGNTTVSKTLTINVAKAPLTVTASSHTITKGEKIPALSIRYDGFVNGENENVLEAKPTVTTTVPPTSPVGKYTVVAAGGTASNYEFTYVDGEIDILDKRIPTVTWAEPAAITYGTALTDAQMNANASYSNAPLAGTLSYFNNGNALKAGDILLAGTHSLKVTFTPTDGDHYISVEKTVSLTVAKAPLTVTANSYTIVKGEAIPALGVNYIGFVNGEDESVLDAKPTATTTANFNSNAGVYDINVAEGSDNNYFFSYIIGTLEIKKITPTISWAKPASITYGTALGDAQLSANADAPGTFTYAPAIGSVLNAGQEQTLSATFTPTDWVNYSEVTKTVTISVAKAPLTVTASSHTITKGENIPALNINYDGFVNGENESVLDAKPTATTAATDASNAGSNAGSYDIVAANGADNNYEFTYVKGTLTIGKITPVISWVTPAAITYGTKLGDEQLSANADAEGTFTYTPTAGTLLNAGQEQTLSATFTPTDKANYNEATKKVTISVAKAPLTVTASSHTITKGEKTPALSIRYDGFVNGENENVLEAKPTVTTTAPPTSPVGKYATTAKDGVDNNYSFTYVDGEIDILDKRIPTVTWAEPAAITYGTALTDAQMNATASYSNALLAGTLSYSTNGNALKSGDILTAGTHSLKVTFTPTDGDHYISVEKTVSLTVAKAPLTVTANSYTIVKGEAIPALGVTYKGFVNGEDESVLDAKPTATTTASDKSNAGAYDINVAEGSDNNYFFAYIIGTLKIKKITPTISWAAPTAIIYGTAVGNAQLNATASHNGTAVAGTLSYTTNGNALNSGDMLTAGTHTLKVIFTPTDVANYNSVEGTATLTVNKAKPTITWNAPSSITYGTKLSDKQQNATADIEGTFTYAPAEGTTLTAGKHDLTATFIPTDAANYSSVEPTVSLTVDKATPTIAWNTPAAITYGTKLGEEQLSATSNIEGTFTYAPAAGIVLNAGEGQTLSATFTPTDKANYNEVTRTAAISVSKAPLTATATSYNIREGEAIPALGITYNGFVNGDTEAVLEAKPTATTTATATSPTGVYAIKVTGGSDDSYEFAYVDGKLTISNPIEVASLQAPQAGCEGDKLSLAYTLTSGKPTEYQIVFDAKALTAGFSNSGYAALPAGNGTVSFTIPSRVADGSYTASLQLRDSYGNISEPSAFEVTVNITADVIVPKFGNVVLIDNHDGRFAGYQWYKNGSAIGGATSQFYKDPNGLSGTYYAQLKTATGQTVNTCSKVLSIKKSASASVSVYPNPARAGQELTVKLSGFGDEELIGAVLTVYSTQGAPVLTLRKVEQENRITLSGSNGVYMGRIVTADGQVLTFKVVLAN